MKKYFNRLKEPILPSLHLFQGYSMYSNVSISSPIIIGMLMFSVHLDFFDCNM